MKTKSFRAERSSTPALSGGTAIVCPADEALSHSQHLPGTKVPWSAAYAITILIITLLISACGSNASPTAIPTVVLDSSNENQPVQVSHSNDGDVVASAIVVPVQEAQLGFSLPGNIKKIHVAAGDQVKAGDLLAELDNVSIQLEVEAAERTVRELTSASAIAAAEQAVATAQKTYDDAKKKVDGIQNRHADNVTIKYLEDQVTLAQNALDQAHEIYKQTGGLSDRDTRRAKASTGLYNAQKAYNSALANLNWYANPPSENDVALANANFDAASAALQEAQWYASELKGETIPAEATGAPLTQLQQARDNLQAAQAQLDQTRLVAPIPGIVVKVDMVAGEYASPGQIVVVVSDTQHLQIKTTDLSERDVTKVQVGAPARIMVDALSQEFDGEVVGISPVATTLGGDVVYEVTISFTEQPEGLLGGMSAEVTIGE